MFKDIHKNRTFLIVLLVTLVSQIIIVQFGSVVFSVDPMGLSLSNWLISIALGSGSLFVGLFIRLFVPDIPNPFDRVQAPVVVTSEEMKDKPDFVKMDHLGSAESKINGAQSPSKNIVPVATFGSAGGHSKGSSISKKCGQESDENISRWSQLRHHILVKKSFKRGRLDISNTQMVTAKAIKCAQQNQAKSLQNHH